MKNSLFILFLFLFYTFSTYSQDQFTEQTSISLIGVSSSSVAWGDYDNDGDLDILLSGYIANNTVTKIYRNNGDNSFTEQITISLTGAAEGSATWGDYDNDGYLDILLTGVSWPSNPFSKIYRNNGDDSFTEQISLSLNGVSGGSATWGDYDNDGDLDYISGGKSKIYRNDGDTIFTEQKLISLSTGESFVFGDYDNDGDLDILLTGFGGTKIYRNNLPDNTFTEQTLISLTSYYGSAVWGDYDNDGDLDILYAGETESYTLASKIYRNNFPENTFTEQTSISLIGVRGSVAWGDYDNDGDLDILLTGSGVSKIYRNNFPENTFTEQTSMSLTGVDNSSVAWGDYDNDGDLDILLTGSGVSKIYRNNNITPNELPSIPSNLQAQVIGNDVSFSWNKSTDNQTPQNGLRYNLVIGSSPEAINFLSPMSDRSNGYRRVISLGNANHTTSWTLKGVPEGEYYWSVQAIDNNFAGSAFAQEKSFTKGKLFLQFTEDTSISLIGVSRSTAVWGDYDNDGDLDILLNGSDEDYNFFTKIYRNDGENTFTEQTSSFLIGISGSSVWGDYDNDDDLDILLTGRTDSGHISQIYRNNGDDTFSAQTSISLAGATGPAAWGDYDNDGDLDILLTGDTGSKSKIYRNNGDNTFTELTSISIIGVDFGDAAWGDYDNDGDLDILLTGDGYNWPYEDPNMVSKIYRNNGDNTFTEQTSISLACVQSCSAAWGDYDNDGDLDLLITGSYSHLNGIAKIYNNHGNNWFMEETSISLLGVTSSSAAWGDYDNDGDLDILSTGRYTESAAGPSISTSIIYRNNGDNSFTEQTSMSLTGVSHSSVAWGDYDNDGDLDILLTGNNSSDVPVSKIYRNNNQTPNTLPAAPTNLNSTVNIQGVTFSWQKSTDNQTLQNGLKYNLVIGTTPNGVNKLSPMSDRSTGYRRVVDLGNTNHDTSWTIKDLSDGQYYWSVQAIDNCFSGSSFSDEQTFTISNTCVSDINPSNYKLSNLSVGNEYYVDRSYTLANIPDEYKGFSMIKTSNDDKTTINLNFHFNICYNADIYIAYDHRLASTTPEWISSNYMNTGKVILDIDGTSFDIWKRTVIAGSVALGDNQGISESSMYFLFYKSYGPPVPIELSKLEAIIVKDNIVVLKWETTTEVNSYGYEVERASFYTSPIRGWVKIGFVPGSGNSNFQKEYSFTDQKLNSGKYSYRLKMIDYDGTFEFSDLVEVDLGLPKNYALGQNYPNPFNPTTKIDYQLPFDSKVTIELYAMTGEKVATLINGELAAGYYNTDINAVALNLSSGIYLYRMSAITQGSDVQTFVQVKKLMLMK